MAIEANNSDPVWLALERITAKRLVTLEMIEAAFPGQYQIIEDSPYSTFYEARNVVLSQDRRIENVDLRISKGASRKGLVIFSINGRCIPFSDVDSMFSSLMLVPPSPHSKREERVFSSNVEHGRLWFGHEMAGRSCLKWIRYDFDVGVPARQ